MENEIKLDKRGRPYQVEAGRAHYLKGTSLPSSFDELDLSLDLELAESSLSEAMRIGYITHLGFSLGGSLITQ